MSESLTVPFNEKVGTVALVVQISQESKNLVEALTDHEEIALFGVRVKSGDHNPLHTIRSLREQHQKDDEEFGDYIEDILCQPFVRSELKEQGVRWFKSKAKIRKQFVIGTNTRPCLIHFVISCWACCTLQGEALFCISSIQSSCI